MAEVTADNARKLCCKTLLTSPVIANGSLRASQNRTLNQSWAMQQTEAFLSLGGPRTVN